MQKESEDIKSIIERYSAITLLSHINPDADAIGTTLGIYAILKSQGRRVEVANYAGDIPRHLDFLPGFSKIKRKMDYEESLIISCDCGSIDRLGFDVEGRDIVNIDHHHTNSGFGKYNFVDPLLSSSAQVAYSLLEGHYDISPQAAVCFYTAMVSDTRNFTTDNVDEETFAFAIELLECGADYRSVSYNLTQRKSLASIRILGRVLDTLTLHMDAQVASLTATREMMSETGALMSDLDGVADYARSLATVEVGILLVEDNDRVRVSLRSKRVDISPVAAFFGGGGHRLAGGFTVESGSIEEILDKILNQIDKKILKKR